MLIQENFQCTQQQFDNTKSSHNINIQCLHCQEIFQRPKKAIISDLSRRGIYPTCCSVTCLHLYKKQFSFTTVNCKQCNIEFSKRNKEITKSPNHFCTMSCAAKFNNAIKPKIIKVIKEIKPKKQKGLATDIKTKKELFDTALNWQAARSTIQKRARDTFYNSNKLKACMVCGYDKHYEVCHIKSVASFSEDALISEINNIDNLIALCPTHHWEFDNSYLTLEMVTMGGFEPPRLSHRLMRPA